MQGIYLMLAGVVYDVISNRTDEILQLMMPEKGQRLLQTVLFEVQCTTHVCGILVE